MKTITAAGKARFSGKIGSTDEQHVEKYLSGLWEFDGFGLDMAGL